MLLHLKGSGTNKAIVVAAHGWSKTKQKVERPFLIECLIETSMPTGRAETNKAVDGLDFFKSLPGLLQCVMNLRSTSKCA